MSNVDENWIIGIDEAGRGPLAGPVAVGCVAMRASDVRKVRRAFKEIWGKDSKKLTHNRRERWYAEIEGLVSSGVLIATYASSSAKIIDSKGIVWGIVSALARAVRKTGINPLHARVLLDGGLYAPPQYVTQETIIKGDEKELVISLASIVAKVRRDRYMVTLGKKHPEYGFERHKGYGTLKHRDTLNKIGVIREHRMSFLRNILS